MTSVNERRRVVTVAGVSTMHRIRQMFGQEALEDYELSEADSFSHARFLLQHEEFDLLVVHEERLGREDPQALTWLASKGGVPVVFLAGQCPQRMLQAYQAGVQIVLPCELALGHSGLLAAGLERALQQHQDRRRSKRWRDRLTQSRRHIDRLVNVVWRMTPRQGEQHWFSQRYMLERLQEELVRAERHKLPLTVALGEIRHPEHIQAEKPTLPEWTVDQIVRAKRRCDVAGQYGIGNFMLLMVQTPRPGGLTCIRRLQNALEQPPEPVPGPRPALRAYFGLTGFGKDRPSAAALLRAAEESLEDARRKSPERIAVG